MKFENLIDAKRHAKDNRKKAESNTLPDSGQQFGPIDSDIFRYFFDLQVKLEKEFAANKGNKDYRTYARKMWEGLIGDINPQNEEFFINLKMQ